MSGSFAGITTELTTDRVLVTWTLMMQILSPLQMVCELCMSLSSGPQCLYLHHGDPNCTASWPLPEGSEWLQVKCSASAGQLCHTPQALVSFDSEDSACSPQCHSNPRTAMWELLWSLHLNPDLSPPRAQALLTTLNNDVIPPGRTHFFCT